MKITFKSLDSELCIAVGALSEITGTRPSEFFGWNEDEDWLERLIFDMKIVGILKKEEKRQHDKAMKKVKRR